MGIPKEPDNIEVLGTAWQAIPALVAMRRILARGPMPAVAEEVVSILPESTHFKSDVEIAQSEYLRNVYVLRTWQTLMAEGAAIHTEAIGYALAHPAHPRRDR